ncbi:unnamed protein product [Rhodiola kirilowii]
MMAVMALRSVPVFDFKACSLLGCPTSRLLFFNSVPMRSNMKPLMNPIEMKAKGPTRTESPKIRNRRVRKKFDGSAKRPRLSVFCSDRQLYAMLIDDHNKKCLFYGSTLQRSMREDPPCTKIEAAKRVGEELTRVCKELGINEISSYDRNGFACGEKMQAFEIAVYEHGFLPR